MGEWQELTSQGNRSGALVADSGTVQDGHQGQVVSPRFLKPPGPVLPAAAQVHLVLLERSLGAGGLGSWVVGGSAALAGVWP